MSQSSINDLRKKEERGFLLTFFIALGIIQDLCNFVLGFRYIHDTGLFFWGMVDSIVFGTILYYIWNWNKKGVYALFIYYFYLFCLTFIEVHGAAFWTTLVTVILVMVIWYFVLKRKLHLFK